MSSNNPGEILELVRGNKIRNLGSLTAERIPGLENVPTIKEQGYDVVGYGMYRGLVAPPDIPAEAVKVLDEAFGKFAKTEDYKKFHKENYNVPGYQNSNNFKNYLAEKEASFVEAVKKLGQFKPILKKK